LLMWGALSDERTGLSFTIAAGPRQHGDFGSESRGTRNNILLSQIRNFPFRRLLRLAGLQWRYSTPPPHGLQGSPFYNFGSNRVEITTPNNSSVVLCLSFAADTCFSEPLSSNGRLFGASLAAHFRRSGVISHYYYLPCFVLCVCLFPLFLSCSLCNGLLS
jgi:hypothetical protein